MSQKHFKRSRESILAKRKAISAEGVTAPKLRANKYVPHTGKKEQAKAKSFYMQGYHGACDDVYAMNKRSAPTMERYSYTK